MCGYCTPVKKPECRWIDTLVPGLFNDLSKEIRATALYDGAAQESNWGRIIQSQFILRWRQVRVELHHLAFETNVHAYLDCLNKSAGWPLWVLEDGCGEGLACNAHCWRWSLTAITLRHYYHQQQPSFGYYIQQCSLMGMQL